MAACAITITGTTGTILIKWNIGGDPLTQTANIGDPIYIDDTATDVTYTSIDGDAVAASGCVDIDELPQAYYLFSWESIGSRNDQANDMMIDGIVTDEGTLSFDGVEYTKNMSWSEVSLAIANLGNVNIVPRSGLQVLTDRSSAVESVVISIIGTVVPELRISNSHSGTYLYLKGSISEAIPEGFEEFNFVESDL